jgi:hypothetical protein
MDCSDGCDPKTLGLNVLKLIRLLRSGELGNGDLLILSGQILCQIGQIVKSRPVFSLAEPADVLDLEHAVSLFEANSMESRLADPNFDITPFIPIILMIVKWLIERRQG